MKTQTEPDKNPPKGTGGHTPPTGGTKADPKKPPKVNDTRAPFGGGVYHSTKTGSGTNSGSGSGTILRGTPAPIQKSSGGNGPSVRFDNGRR